MRRNCKTDDPITMVNVDALDEVQDFAYLGSLLSTDGYSTTDAKARMRKASQTLAMLIFIWKAKQLRLQTELSIYTNTVVSVLLAVDSNSSAHARNIPEQISTDDTRDILKKLIITDKELLCKNRRHIAGHTDQEEKTEMA